MDEIIALEQQIMAALPRADTAAAMFDADTAIHIVIRSAQDILSNSWRGGGSRLNRLRMIAAALTQFNEEKPA
jgi:anti-sigma factor ChrR (cupin superfamily)